MGAPPSRGKEQPPAGEKKGRTPYGKGQNRNNLGDSKDDAQEKGRAGKGGKDRAGKGGKGGDRGKGKRLSHSPNGIKYSASADAIVYASPTMEEIVEVEPSSGSTTVLYSGKSFKSVQLCAKPCALLDSVTAYDAVSHSTRHRRTGHHQAPL